MQKSGPALVDAGRTDIALQSAMPLYENFQWKKRLLGYPSFILFFFFYAFGVSKGTPGSLYTKKEPNGSNIFGTIKKYWIHG